MTPMTAFLPLTQKNLNKWIEFPAFLFWEKRIYFKVNEEEGQEGKEKEIETNFDFEINSPFSQES